MSIYRNIHQEEYMDIESRILYEDNHLIVFDKRAGEIVQGDKTGDEALSETLKAYIAQRDSKPGHVFMGVPHRLDRPVSGVCVFAKTSKALERLNEMLRKGEIHKTYWALIATRPPKDEDMLVGYIVRNEKQNKSYICGRGENGNAAKQARLHYRLIKTTDRYFLLEIELYTGRHHQIRCQLAGIGCPIKGDLKYGAKRSNPDGGISLLARNIRFVHPVKGEEVDITAPVPSSWKGV